MMRMKMRPALIYLYGWKEKAEGISLTGSLFAIPATISWLEVLIYSFIYSLFGSIPATISWFEVLIYSFIYLKDPNYFFLPIISTLNKKVKIAIRKCGQVQLTFTESSHLKLNVMSMTKVTFLPTLAPNNGHYLNSALYIIN